MVPGVSFAQRKTLAVAGVAKGGDSCKEQSWVSRQEDRKLSGLLAGSLRTPKHQAVAPGRLQSSPEATGKTHTLRMGWGTGLYPTLLDDLRRRARSPPARRLSRQPLTAPEAPRWHSLPGETVRALAQPGQRVHTVTNGRPGSVVSTHALSMQTRAITS